MPHQMMLRSIYIGACCDVHSDYFLKYLSQIKKVTKNYAFKLFLKL